MLMKGLAGDRITRRDALDKVLGRAAFSDDYKLDGLLHMKVRRSEIPHGLIKKIDRARAGQMPGVVAVFTHHDVPGSNVVGPIASRKDQRVLAEHKVRYVGDPIALVVAESVREAECAAACIDVEYEELPSFFDPEDALHADTIIHEEFEGGNCFYERKIKRGDVDQAMAEADVVIERTYHTHIQEHMYLEPDAGVAWIDEDGRYAIAASTQNTHYDHSEVTAVLGAPPEQVRVIQAATGGGFGGKLDLNVQCLLAVALYHLRRPISCTYTREEQLLATPKRHPLRFKYKTGATRDGRLLAVDVDVLGDTGAYVSYGMAVATRAAIYAAGPYRVPNVRVRSRMVYTNHPVMGALRTFGVTQAAFAHESQMDILARELNMDPFELRLKNALEAGSETITGQLLEASVGIKECLCQVRDYGRQNVLEPPPPGRLTGRGIGCFIYGIGNTAGNNPSNADLKLDPQGGLTLYDGVAELGQGSDTIMPQIAATVLNLNVSDIRLVRADTALTKTSGSSSASRQTYISGRAVYEAAGQLRDRILAAVETYFGMAPADLVMEDGLIRNRHDQRVVTDFQEISRKYFEDTGNELAGAGYYDPYVTPLDPETGQGIPYATYAYGCQMVDLQVDAATGEVTVSRIVAAHDCGKAINPKNVEGQIAGGALMGMGYALMEEYVPGRTRKMRDYFIPSVKDIPEMVPIIVEDPEPTGPFGAKGVGEPTLVPTAAAIVNALEHALGERIYQLPASLERVMELLTRCGLRTDLV